MGAHLVPAPHDPIRPTGSRALTLAVDGEQVIGLVGQSIAGVIMAADRLELRRTAGAIALAASSAESASASTAWWK